MNFEIPIYKPPELPDMPQWHMWAETQFEIIKRYIQDFESKLDPALAVGLLLTNFGREITMNVTEIGFEESVMMVYKGFVNGSPATLLQHMNQISFLLTEIPRPQPETPRTPIGFIVPRD